jgi:hypothetical protein
MPFVVAAVAERRQVLGVVTPAVVAGDDVVNVQIIGAQALLAERAITPKDDDTCFVGQRLIVALF